MPTASLMGKTSNTKKKVVSNDNGWSSPPTQTNSYSKMKQYDQQRVQDEMPRRKVQAVFDTDGEDDQWIVGEDEPY